MGTNHPIKPIIFFDGVCNLCNQSVLFVIRRDKKAKFNFAPLQSGYAQHHLNILDSTAKELNSIVLLKNGRVYKRSRAVLEIALGLAAPWPLLFAFVVIPAPLRDLVYDWVARHRYKWFGKKDECMIPTPQLKSRFIA
ncbi:MAG: thiol-disulfide oxidoreductase DCC family protein [Bacteroidota bacterium]|jgi:predicted DCC family thiol-disulfide oxidoreductase YuxK|nr:DCC1-like thiol-disulfide oxidoreductase family protein [Cytophagales bacterium]